MARRFGGSGRSFEPHIRAARKRNLESIGRTHEEAKADSVMFWHKMLVEFRQRKNQCEQQLETEKQTLRKYRDDFDKASGAELKVALLRLETQNGFVAVVWRELCSAIKGLERHMHTIDHLWGNYAPLEIDVTDRNRELEYPSGPTTEKEATETLRAMIAKIKQERDAEEAKTAVDRFKAMIPLPELKQPDGVVY